MINLPALFHEAKSKYAYSFNENTIHIRFRCAKNDLDKVTLIYGDPFNWKDSKHQSIVEEMRKDYSTSLHDYYFIAIKPKWKRCKYLFIIEKDNDRFAYGSHTIEDLNKHPEKALNLFNYFNFPFINEADIFRVPDWVKSTVWYQIFPERFNNGNTENDPKQTLPWGSVESVRNDMFFGGDLQGVIDKLDYLVNLGINGIYFTPIFKSPSSHKYDTEDYYQVDRQFGTNETFGTLVEEAHNRGIKIMLDAVFNHCGFYHPFFQDVVKYNEQSPYKDYFYIKKFPVFSGNINEFHFIEDESEINFDTFAFTPHMPKWKTSNPEVRKYLLDVGSFWVKEYDIDGWRLDVSNEVDHEFWREFRKTMDSLKKDFYIIGENWDESNPWLRGEQFSAVMNYSFTYPVWNFFAKGISNAYQFRDDISELLTTYPKNVARGMFNLLDSHDTERILSFASEDVNKVKLAYLFLLSFTGTPSIYYGGEIGLSGKHDPDNRRCMIWDKSRQNLDLFNYIKKLIEIRKNSKALQSGDFIFIETNDLNQFIYLKQYEQEKVLIIINNNPKQQEVRLPENLINHKVLNLITNEEYTIPNIIPLNPYGYLLLQLI